MEMRLLHKSKPRMSKLNPHVDDSLIFIISQLIPTREENVVYHSISIIV